ncbi:MAG: SnoaL-like domain [Thermoleophilaceae bacterium]|nr:SnoaL-like domain [Thermoleophilaceae bacterium]
MSERTQANIALVLDGWLQPVQRRDFEALGRHVHPDVFWQGLRPEYRCDGRDEVLAFFARGEDPATAVDRVELLAGDDHVVVSVRSPGLETVGEVRVDGQVHLVFTLRDGLIVRIEDYAARADALRAAGIDELADWR